MARVSGAEIEEMKARISVERLAESAGVELKQHGKDLLGRCPFHDDKTPSLVITPSKNLWHCLGACQAGGSVIDWVMRAQGVSFRHAVELLRGDNPSLVAAKPSGKRPAKRSLKRKMPSVVETDMKDAQAFLNVVEFYQRTLEESPEGQAYLKKRGLVHPELIKTFRLGLANRTLSYRLPAKSQEAGVRQREQLQRLGVLRQSGHEHFNGSLVIPVFDEHGQVVEMYGRKLHEHLRAETPKHLYLPGPHAGVWNSAALSATKEVILCESLIDALTFWCAGFRNVTASYGVEGFTESHLSSFKKHGIEKVLIAYDRDDAGDAAAQKLSGRLQQEGLETWRIRFPRGMDANEYALKVQPPAQSLAAAVRSAEWLGRGQAPRRETEVVEPRTAECRVPEVGGGAESASEPGQCTLESAAPVSSSLVALEAPKAVPESAPSEAESSPVAPALPAPIAASPASPSFPSSAEEEHSSDGDQVTLTFGDRKWRVRGLLKNKTPGILKVNILLRRERFGFHVDTLELYSARHRAAYVTQAAAETGVEERVLKRDLGQVLLRLEQLQEERKEGADSEASQRRELTEQERNEALGLLRDPELIERILVDFEKLGVVGERVNKLTAYLAATSRKLDRPLAIVVQSSSAAGKSSLMDAVLKLIPPEERVSYSAMTGQSLFYMGEMELCHKVLSIAEEEGAERAAYALKLLQSEGALTIASTGKDPTTGRLVTQEYRVEGPVMIFLTTTAIEVDEELLNRCIVLSVDETRAQTRAIHAQQRASRTLEGQLLHAERGQLMALHQNAQQLLRPLLVANPYATELSFLDHQTRTRRDHMKYLTLIESVTLLHQYQRPVKEVEHQGAVVRYIEVTKEDIGLANELCAEVLGRTLDELPAQTRRLLEQLDCYVGAESERLGLDRGDYRFSRRSVREAMGWGDTQLKVHLGRLVELEYVLPHRGKQGQSYAYELLYQGEGQDGSRFLTGLLDVGEVPMTQTSRGRKTHFAGPGRGVVGGQSGLGQRGVSEEAEEKMAASHETLSSSARKDGPGRQRNGHAHVAVEKKALSLVALGEASSGA